MGLVWHYPHLRLWWKVQMTKDSRTLSLEIDAESQGGTPRDVAPDRGTAERTQSSLDDAPHPSEGWVRLPPQIQLWCSLCTMTAYRLGKLWCHGTPSCHMAPR